MINLLLRFGVLAAGIALTIAAWQSWTAGDPPPWSMFAPRAEAVVASSTVHEGRITSGAMRYTPLVLIETPEGPRELAGVRPSFFSYDRQRSEEIAAAYPSGATIQTRLVGGVPTADRYDLFGMAHAITMAIFALMLLFLGSFLAVALGPGRKPKPSE